MNQMLVLALVFIGISGMLVGAYLFINRRTLASSEAARARLREEEERERTATLRSIMRDAKASTLPAFDRVLAGQGITAWLAEQFVLAGVQMTAGAFLLRCGVAGVTGFLLGQLATGRIFPAAVFAVIGGALPFVWLQSKRSKRAAAFQEQLPDAIDMLVSSMKAGYSFQAAMKFIGEEMPAPLGPEFQRFYEEQRLGVEVRIALLALQARVASMDLKMLVTAILIQRETGGNLSEVLEKISHLMRERVALKGEIATLTAESKLSARILSALPLVVWGLVMIVNPGFNAPMMDTDWGPIALAVAAVSVMIGYWWMMKIADIDI